MGRFHGDRTVRQPGFARDRRGPFEVALGLQETFLDNVCVRWVSPAGIIKASLAYPLVEVLQFVRRKSVYGQGEEVLVATVRRAFAACHVAP